MAAVEDVYLLGICCNLHEASAAIVKNGVLIAAAEEERFSRRKHDNRFPVGAIAYCLREAGVSMSDVSHAGFYWQPWKGLLKRVWWLVRYFPASLQTFQGGKHWRGSAGTLLRHLAVPFKLRRMGFRGRFYFIDHHDAHAASAFLVSPFESAAIITSDLCGENCTTLLGRGDGHRIRRIRRFYLPHSLGIFYAALTQFLGYDINIDEYKVMGLASYGQPRFADTFSTMVRFDEGRLRNDSSWFNFHTGSGTCYSPRFVETFGAPCPDEGHVDADPYRDIAASGQKVLEQRLTEIARWCRDRSGADHLCMAGGVSLNSAANGRLLDQQIFKSIWVQPASGDAGCALGIPFHIWHERLGHPRAFVMDARVLGSGVSRVGHAGGHSVARPHGAARGRRGAAGRTAAGRRPRHRLVSGPDGVGSARARQPQHPRGSASRGDEADHQQQDQVSRAYRPFAPSVLEEDAA